MNRRFRTLTALALVALCISPSIGQAQKTKLDTISYAQLGKLVRAEKGKAVVVYFWAHY